MQNTRKYKIADFQVAMNCRSKYMQNLCSAYESSEGAAQIDLCYSDEMRMLCQKKEMTHTEFEYNFTLSRFAGEIVDKNAFCFHAAALSVDGEGILFSADSGIGKSTHARLWQEFMKDHEVLNLNDDKPVIRLKDGKPWVYGSPWSGKHSIQCNRSAPVKALVFLERGEKNRIEPMKPEEVFSMLFPQVIGGKKNQQQVAQLLELIDLFVKKIVVYRLSCNISEEAVRIVYHTVWEKEKKDED